MLPESDRQLLITVAKAKTARPGTLADGDHVRGCVIEMAGQKRLNLYAIDIHPARVAHRDPPSLICRQLDCTAQRRRTYLPLTTAAGCPITPDRANPRRDGRSQSPGLDGKRHMPDLLRTKLAPPRLRAALVPREALLARLDDGLERKLTMLSAPAGFGKTTLVRQWLARNDERRTMNDEGGSHRSSFIVHRFDVAWLSLDSGDDDPVRFLRYLIAACQLFQADLGTDALAVLSAGQQPRFEAALTALINDLVLLERRCALVLEDYHSISAHQVHELTTFLLDHLPATLHILLLTRSDPPLPLARLRAQDELCE